MKPSETMSQLIRGAGGAVNNPGRASSFFWERMP